MHYSNTAAALAFSLWMHRVTLMDPWAPAKRLLSPQLYAIRDPNFLYNCFLAGLPTPDCLFTPPLALCYSDSRLDYCLYFSWADHQKCF